jgi:predicted nucleotidyltransferase
LRNFEKALGQLRCAAAQAGERELSDLERLGLVQRAVLFGSRAKGNFRESSDIDFALEGEHSQAREMADMRVELDDEPITHRVDLVDAKTIKHRGLLEHIERG